MFLIMALLKDSEMICLLQMGFFNTVKKNLFVYFTQFSAVFEIGNYLVTSLRGELDSVRHL